MMLLAEYVLATGDQSVLPGLRRIALEAAHAHREPFAREAAADAN
jgi:hypothetical protein